MQPHRSRYRGRAIQRALELAGALFLTSACAATATPGIGGSPGAAPDRATAGIAAITEAADSVDPNPSIDPTQSIGAPAPATAISSASYPAAPCAPAPVDVPAGIIPEGAAIGWTDCSGLWAVGADGRPVQVPAPPDLAEPRSSSPAEPRFSPDRRQIAFQVRSEDVERERSRVYVAALDGTDPEPRLVIDGEALTRQIPQSEHMPEGSWTLVPFYDWLPDGSGLAFTTEEEHWSEDGDNRWNYRDDLWSMPLDGGAPRQLLPPGKGGHFAFSPDGQHVAITRLADEPLRATVAVARARGSDHRVLFEHPPMASESDWRPYQLPQWAPDSQSLLVVSPAAYQYPGDALAYFDSPARLLRLSLNGGTETIAEAGKGSLPWANDYNAWWSPDGRRVAFLASAEAPPAAGAAGYPGSAPAAGIAPTSAPATAPDLVIAGTDGTRSIHPDAAPPELNDFAWSPDGGRYSFPHWDRSPEGAIRPGGARLGSAELAPRTPAGSADWRETAWLTGDRLVVATGDGLLIYRVDEDLEAVDPTPIMTGAQPAQLVVAPVRP